MQEMSQADNTQNKTNQKRTTTKTTRALSAQDCESVALPRFHGKLEVEKEPELWFCQLSDMGCNHSQTSFPSALFVGKGVWEESLKVSNL